MVQLGALLEQPHQLKVRREVVRRLRDALLRLLHRCCCGLVVVVVVVVVALIVIVIIVVVVIVVVVLLLLLLVVLLVHPDVLRCRRHDQARQARRRASARRGKYGTRELTQSARLTRPADWRASTGAAPSDALTLGEIVRGNKTKTLHEYHHNMHKR